MSSFALEQLADYNTKVAKSRNIKGNPRTVLSELECHFQQHTLVGCFKVPLLLRLYTSDIRIMMPKNYFSLVFKRRIMAWKMFCDLILFLVIAASAQVMVKYSQSTGVHTDNGRGHCHNTTVIKCLSS